MKKAYKRVIIESIELTDEAVRTSPWQGDTSDDDTTIVSPAPSFGDELPLVPLD